MTLIQKVDFAVQLACQHAFGAAFAVLSPWKKRNEPPSLLQYAASDFRNSQPQNVILFTNTKSMI